jgi:hypothetical protein
MLPLVPPDAEPLLPASGSAAESNGLRLPQLASRASSSAKIVLPRARPALIYRTFRMQQPVRQ